MKHRTLLNVTSYTAGITAALILVLSSSLAAAAPEGDYRQLLGALKQKKLHALSEAEEAQLLISGYQEFLEDPELHPEGGGEAEDGSPVQPDRIGSRAGSAAPGGPGRRGPPAALPSGGRSR